MTAESIVALVVQTVMSSGYEDKFIIERLNIGSKVVKFEFLTVYMKQPLTYYFNRDDKYVKEEVDQICEIIYDRLIIEEEISF